MESNQDGKPKVIRLCGVQGCCPTVEISKDDVVIRDDDGGQVKLTKAQFAELQNARE